MTLHPRLAERLLVSDTCLCRPCPGTLTAWIVRLEAALGGGNQTMAPEEQEGGMTRQYELKSSQEIAAEVGVSASTIDRVRTILVEGSEEQIESLRTKNEKGYGPWRSHDIRESAV